MSGLGSRRRLLGLISAGSLASSLPWLGLSGCTTTPVQTDDSDDYAEGLKREPGRVGIPPARLESDFPGVPEIAFQAFSLVGIPYRYGGNTPETGFDCSGLIVYVVRGSLEVQLPRTVQQMATSLPSLPLEDRLPGDLVLFNTLGRRYSHAGIYIGQDRFVHAPSSGGTVRLDRLDAKYWARRLTGLRRVRA